MKRWLGYFFFFVSAVVFFLYLLFPAGSVKDYIVSQIDRIDPRLAMTAKNPLLRFPPGIELQEADIQIDKRPLVRLESISISPHFLSLFSSQRTFGFIGKAYEGETRGELWLAKDKKWRIKGTGDGFQAELLPMATVAPQGSLTGTIAVDYEISSDQSTLKINVSEGSFILFEPFLEIESIRFTRLTLDAVVEQGRMRIKKAQISGSEINGDLTGQMLLRQSLFDSILDLSGIIKPHPLFVAKLRKKLPPGFLSDQIATKGMTFKIGGTVNAPEMAF